MTRLALLLALAAPSSRVLKPDATGTFEPVKNVFRNGVLQAPGIDYDIRLVPRGKWAADDIITTLE